MNIAIVGPTHPYKGGIAQHTTKLAQQLQAAGHDVSLISWKNQYPFFYPGEQFVPGGRPELPPFHHTIRALSWKNPVGWLRWGRRFKDFDHVILIWWVPTIQGPVYQTMLRAAGGKRPHVTVVCHNVGQHEPKPWDKALTKYVLGRAQRIIVHSKSQARLAKGIVDSPVKIARMPIHFEAQPNMTSNAAKDIGMLFFGFVRPYKGVDVLLEALAKVPKVRLMIAGDFWGGSDEYKTQIKRLKLDRRVTIRDEYLPSEDLATLISKADVVVAPYKSGSASQNALLAFTYGTPVIATTAGSLGEQVRDNVDGLLCEPGDIDSLAEAIKQFYKPGVAQRLRKGIPDVSGSSDWDNYIRIVTKET